MWLPMLACLFVIQHYARQSGALETGTLGSLYLGIALFGALYLSLGCFASALTRSQMVAAMVTLMLGVSLFALGYLADQIPADAPWQAQISEPLRAVSNRCTILPAAWWTPAPWFCTPASRFSFCS